MVCETWKNLGDLGGSFAVDTIGEDQHAAAHVSERRDGGFDPSRAGPTEHGAGISFWDAANLQQIRPGFTKQPGELTLPVSDIGTNKGGGYTLRDIRQARRENYHLITLVEPDL